MDDRNQTDKAAIPIQRTVNKDLIQAAFRDLVPYSQVNVNLNFPTVTPELDQLIKSNYQYANSFVSGFVFASPQRYGVVNVKPAYDYMLSHLNQFESQPFFNENTMTMTVPVFAFAFSGQTYFTDTYKWYIGNVAKIDWENDALLGEALPKLVMISYNQWEFTRGNSITPPQPGKGEGMTETIIHETGHEFGLMHPHQYGDIGDFITSPMGYFTNDYKFGQIDKDSIQRAHVDQLYMATEQLLAQSPSVSSSTLSQANSDLAQAEASYEQMNYTAAIPPVLAAFHLAQQATGNSSGLPQSSFEFSTAQFLTTLPTMQQSPSATSYIPYLVIGILVGLLAAAAILRRKKP
jgi:hypothetical protein